MPQPTVSPSPLTRKNFGFASRHIFNLVLDLVVATDSLIPVSDDTDLTELSPWNGRAILRPWPVSRLLDNASAHE